MNNEHMICTCNKCGASYDMDFEQHLDDDHGNCYSEDWSVEVIDCQNSDCGVHNNTPTKLTLDLSAIPGGST